MSAPAAIRVEALESRVLLAGDVTPSGDVVIQAEVAHLSGAVVDTKYPGFNGTGYVDYLANSGGYLDLEVDVPKAGMRGIEIRYALVLPVPSPDLRMRLEVNGVAAPGEVVFAPTGAWDTWRGAVAQARVPAGRNHIRLVSTGRGGPNVDSMVVHAPFPDVPPVQLPTFQAEDARVSGAVVSRQQRGFTGSGYVDYVNKAGDFVEFSFDTPDVPGVSEQPYRLMFRYANGGAAARPMVLRVDDSDLIQGVTFQPTGAWTNWDTTGSNVMVPGGHHTARLTAIGSSGPNLDAITLDAPVYVDRQEVGHALVKGPAFSRKHTGYLGAGYADYVNDAGDFVEWTLDLPGRGAGDYEIAVWYANGGKTDRPLEVRVTGPDGRTVTRTMHFAPTGSWSNWGQAFVNLPLFAGTQRVRLTSTGSNGPNVSALWATAFAPPPPAPRDFPDFNDQASEAPAAPVGGFQFLEIDEPTDVDVMRVDVAAGRRLAFAATRYGGTLDPYIRLFDAGGRQLAANDNAASPNPGRQPGDAYLEYAFPEAGTYYVAFSDRANITYDVRTGAGDRAGGTGRCRVVVYDNGGATPAPSGPDPDDQFSEATAAPFDSRFDDQSVSSPTDVDLYRVTLAPDLDEPTVQLTNAYNSGASLLMRLFDAGGGELARRVASPLQRVASLDLRNDNTLEPLTRRYGDYYVGISAIPNTQYDPLTGAGDAAASRFGGYSIEMFPHDPLPPS